jgi:hypothetical protein
VRVPALATPPVAAPSIQRSFPLLKALIPLLVVLAAAGFWFLKMRPPAEGSREDLTARLDAVEVDALVETNEFYTSEPDCHNVPTCPGLVRYYSIPGSIEAARDEVAARLSEKGFKVTPNGVDPNLIVASEESGRYMYFLVFHPPGGTLPMHNVLPPSVEADLGVVLNPYVK